MEKYIIVLFVNIFVVLASCGVHQKQVKPLTNNNTLQLSDNDTLQLNENEPYLLWSIRTRISGGQTSHEFLFNPDIIKNLSLEIKTIVAFYSKFLSPLYPLTEKDDAVFADALGGFSTLEEAQKILLMDKEQTFEKLGNKMLKSITFLFLKYNENFISFDYIGSDFYKSDDYIIENKKTGKVFAVDPTINDYFCIDYVTYSNNDK